MPTENKQIQIEAYASIKPQLERFIDAGGSCICWITETEDALTHDTILSATTSQLISMFSDIRSEIGDSVFDMLVLSSRSVRSRPVVKEAEKATTTGGK